MFDLPSLDAHAHFDPHRSLAKLAEAGPVHAMTLSLDETARVVDRKEPIIAWGVGCHPRKLMAQQAFDPNVSPGWLRGRQSSVRSGWI